MTTPCTVAHDTALADLDAAYHTLKSAEADRRARRITHDEMVAASLVYDAAVEACFATPPSAAQLSGD